MLGDLQKRGGARRIVHMLAVARAHVQVTGNNVIVLINRDTASVYIMREKTRNFSVSSCLS